MSLLHRTGVAASRLSQHRPLISRQAEAHRHRTVPQARLIASRDSRRRENDFLVEEGAVRSSLARSLVPKRDRGSPPTSFQPDKEGSNATGTRSEG